MRLRSPQHTDREGYAMSIWDDDDIKPDEGSYIKFEVVGDGNQGRIKSIGRKIWDDGSAAPQLELACDDGEDRTLTAGQRNLKLRLIELRPEPGDWISVYLTSVEKRSGNKTLKHFDVVVRSAGAARSEKAQTERPALARATYSPPPPDDDDPPF